jgi:large subunit ribosomal protein L21
MTMYAIFEAKGKQFRAEPDATLRLPTLDAEPGDRVTFDHVLLAQSDYQVLVGQPSLDGASVAAEVVQHGRDDKIVVYKMKRRKGYRRKQGHRQGFTDVRILDIDVGSEMSAKRRPAKKKEAPAAAEAAVQEQVDAKVAQVSGEAAEILITDSARALAEEAALDLASIEGTGKEGRILKSDVQKAIKKRDEA